MPVKLLILLLALGCNLKDIFVIGSGGFAKEVAQILSFFPERWNFKGYIVKGISDHNLSLPYGPVYGTEEDLIDLKTEVDLVIGIGDPKVRKKIHSKFSNFNNIAFPNVIHPSVFIDRQHVSLGFGNIFCANAVVTCDIKIGDQNLFNWNVTVGHDSNIGSCCVVNPSVNLSGFVTLKDEILIGVAATILQNLTVGSYSVLGAGSLLTKDLPEKEIWFGSPARFVRQAVRD